MHLQSRYIFIDLVNCCFSVMIISLHDLAPIAVDGV